MSDVIDNSKVSSIEKYDNRIRVSNYDLTRFDDSAFNIVKFTDCDLTGITGEIAIIENDPEFRDCNLTGSELRVKSLLIVNSHKGIDIVNGIL